MQCFLVQAIKEDLNVRKIRHENQSPSEWRRRTTWEKTWHRPGQCITELNHNTMTNNAKEEPTGELSFHSEKVKKVQERLKIIPGKGHFKRHIT